jgi:hypothetical protein
MKKKLVGIILFNLLLSCSTKAYSSLNEITGRAKDGAHGLDDYYSNGDGQDGEDGAKGVGGQDGGHGGHGGSSTNGRGGRGGNGGDSE